MTESTAPSAATLQLPKIGNPLRMGFLCLMAAVILIPLGLIILISLQEQAGMLSPDANFRPETIQAYIEAWMNVPFPRYFLNSLLVAGLTCLGSTFTAVLAAYAFARLEFPGREPLFYVVLGTLMIPDHITLIPNYLTFARFRALDSYAALILPFLAWGFSVFFLRQYMLGIPRSLDEAARMDGAGHPFILRTIIVPLSWPAISVVALFSFMKEWNNFIWPLLATTSQEMRTVQIGLRYLFRQQGEGAGVDWPLVMAGSVIVLAPLLLAYIFAERHLIRGITLGSFR
ncbi:carbohydrate ABC transporter permease [Palleronia sp.]|uniref:carbohydrate ABC transporter permease n=1 Tax=Palleronia sp. TaxID=1940284 RepID=UPI0035C79AB6